MIYGYAQVSTDGQSVDAQVRQLTKARCKKVFRETASGAKTDHTQTSQGARANRRRRRADGDQARPIGAIDAGPPEYPWHDRRPQGRVPVPCRHLGRYHQRTGRLMLTVLGGLAEFERELIRARTGEGRARAKARGVKMGRPPKLTPTRSGSPPAPRCRRANARYCSHLQCLAQHDFSAERVRSDLESVT